MSTKVLQTFRFGPNAMADNQFTLVPPVESSNGPAASLPALPDAAASGAGSAGELARRNRSRQLTRNLIVFGAMMAMFNFALMTLGMVAAKYLILIGIAIVVLGTGSRWSPRACSVAALVVFIVGQCAVAMFDAAPLLGGWLCNAPTLFAVIVAVVASFELGRPRLLRDNLPLVQETRSPEPFNEAATPISIPRSQNAFVDKSFAERRTLSYWAIGALIVAGAAAIVASSGDSSYLVAVGPLCTTISIIFGFRFVFPKRFRITEVALESIRPFHSIRFDDMVGAVADGDLKSGRFAIVVLHPTRQIRLGSRLTCDSWSLLEFLCRRASGSITTGEIPPVVQAFLTQQRVFSPADQIHLYRYFPRPEPRNAAATLIRLGSAILLALPLMLVVHDISPRSMEWIIFSFVFCSAIVGPIILGFGFYERVTCRKRARWYDGSTLALSPDGLAIAHADFEGELKWSEIQGGQFTNHPDATNARLALDVGGAAVVIANVYDAPLSQIADEIERLARIRFRR